MPRNVRQQFPKVHCPRHTMNEAFGGGCQSPVTHNQSELVGRDGGGGAPWLVFKWKVRREGAFKDIRVKG